MLLPFGTGMIIPLRNEVGIWPERRIALKIHVRMSVREGGANFRCLLERLSWPAAFLRGRAEIRTSISSVVISSGSVTG